MTTSYDDFHPALKYSFQKLFADSKPVEDGTPKVRGYDFNEGVNYQKIFQAFPNVGFQASHLGRAIGVVQDMIECKLKPVPPVTEASFHKSHTPVGRKTSNCTIMMGCTSNMASSGNREIVRYLLQHSMVDLVVMTAGGIEEDIMKCLSQFYIGDFDLDGQEWTPSKFIWRMGQEINHKDSFCYWAYKNKIPIMSPAITDGGLGDCLFAHRHTHPQNSLKLDLVEDIQLMNDMAIFSVNTGVLILGGGVIKHHIMNANCFRGGSDFAVYINTAAEFDGSDSGAMPDEAVAWGKIKAKSKMVKVFADATLVLPILVGETFAKRQSDFKAFSDSH